MPKKTFLPQAPKGFKDILPVDQKYYEFVKEIGSKHLRINGFGKIDLPTLEYQSLYQRGVGEETEIVKKEMFVVERKSKSEEKENWVMRPEGTAGVARAYIEHGMHTKPQPVMLYYYGPFFRYEQPQEGRYREHWQLGGEILGTSKPSADAEAIRIMWDILNDIGIKDIVLYINSLGCPHCRPNTRRALQEYFSLYKNKLCSDCKRRFTSNIFRILDCKNPKCKNIIKDAPPILDNLCVYCKNHFTKVLELLDELKINYDLDSSLVRGFDYYTRTIFEVSTLEDKEKKLSLGGGGRYDNLVEILGGPSTPAVGFSLGVDRIVELLKRRKIPVPDLEKPQIFLAQLGESAKSFSYQLLKELRENGFSVQATPYKDSLKAQLRFANRIKVKFTLILGQKEINDKTIIVRDMQEGVQEIVSQLELINYLKEKMLKKKR